MTDAQIAQSLNVPQGTTLYDFSWPYPQEFTDLVKTAGWPTEVIDGQTIPVFKSGSDDWKNKLFLDGVQPPLTSNDMNGVLLAILTRPDTGAQMAVGLGMLQYGGGSNPWITSYFGNIDNVKSWATGAMSKDPAVRLVAAKELALVAYLVEHYSDAGVQLRDTVLNIRTARANENGLAVDPANPKTISNFLINTDQYRGTFVVFKVKYKGMTGCTPEEWGVNTLDGRFALLKSNCAPPTVIPKPTPTPTPSSCTPKPGGTKSWSTTLGKWICKDPPSDGPGSKGNDGGGAGLGDGTGTLTTTPPKPKPSPSVTPTPTPTATGDPGGY